MKSVIVIGRHYQTYDDLDNQVLKFTQEASACTDVILFLHPSTPVNFIQNIKRNQIKSIQIKRYNYFCFLNAIIKSKFIFSINHNPSSKDKFALNIAGNYYFKVVIDDLLEEVENLNQSDLEIHVKDLSKNPNLLKQLLSALNTKPRKILT